jgi:phytoene dehydrogenase-like protein
VRAALDRYFRDPKLKLLLTADCSHWGSPPRRTSFVFDSMLRLSYFLGNYYPRGGSQAFADELAQRFEERGGHILMSATVRRIVVEGGEARGVQLDARLEVVLRGAGDDDARVDELAALDARDDADDGVVKRTQLGHRPPP